ncbi:MAG: TIGR01777 family oxidoreductase [Planctomycetota bacterium]|nr:TIGR01777 family oxidoreductase [Planctomycetota bacterium]
MRIAITGATGFLGGHLVPALVAAGHEPLRLVRARPGRAAGDRSCLYDPEDVASVRRALEGCDAVINLAGANVLGGRWTTEFLETVRHSRLHTTRVLVDAMLAGDVPPRVLLSASAIGIYGPREPDEVCTEATAEMGHDFLAVLCRDWEAEAQRAANHGTRVVALRIGVVLGRGGGALEKMEGPFRWGLGGRIGGGRQIMSWIHVDDLVRLMLFCLEREELSGPVNATAPQPVSNRELTAAFAAALRRPAFLPVPTFALKAMFGRGASVLTTGQRVLPAVAQEHGFAFEHETIRAAFEDLYGD